MSARLTGVATVAAVAALAAACGKKGPPQAPFRPDPARITELAARALETRVEVVLTLPTENADGTTPSIIEQVELYAVQAPPPAPPDPAGAPAAPAAPPQPPSAIVQPENLVATVQVAPAADAVAPTAGEPVAAPSGVVTIPHDIAPILAAHQGAEALPSLRYAVVGLGRGRRGPASGVEVPLSRRPPEPAAVRVMYTESTMTVAWEPAGEGLAAEVYEVPPAAAGTPPVRRSVSPVAGGELSLPVVFGRSICLEVRHVLVAGRASIEGRAAPVVCVTPVDRFAPPAPAGLVAIAEEGAVVLTWRGVTAADLAGYLVLRGEGTSETLQPLTPAPLADRSFRDTTARAGVTYTYAVVAVDDAAPPNRSAESERQTVTAR